MNLLLIDGNSIVNRAYFGIRMLNAPDGTPTNGIYGFLTILQRLLDEVRPDALAVAFDLHAPTFRHQQYALYKAQRKGMPEELAVQMPILKQVLDAMGVYRMELEGYEADDLLGTVSRLCAEAGGQCAIATGDKDSFQLITDAVRVLHIKTRMGQTETIEYTPARFREEYGFEPARMVDLKALMGDASDNIPGVPGVGEKTALDLLRRWGSLENIYADLGALDVKDSVRKKLAAGEESARMSFALATIDTAAPFAADFEKMRWEGVKQSGALYDLLLRLGFQKMIEKWGIKADKTREITGKVVETVAYTEILNEEMARSAAAVIAGSGALVCIRAGEDFDRFAFFQASQPPQAWALDAGRYEGDLTAALRAMLTCPVPLAGHDVKDLMRFCLDRGLDVTDAAWRFDSALAGYLLDATAGSYAPERLAVQYLGRTLPEPDAGQSGQMSLLDDGGEGARCAALEALTAQSAAIAALMPVMEQRLAEAEMTGLLHDMELPLSAVLAEMEHTGFLVDREALAAFGAALNEGIDALQKRIWDMAEGEFNILSPRQLGTVLFEKLMLPAGKKTKTGWSTNADVLEKLRDKHPIVNAVLEYRMLTKLKSTYAEGLLKVIEPDGRIRTRFMMTVTDTGRLSSREPNLQNIPIRKELGSQIRRMFVAGPGNVLVDADYSQIELRLLAHISADENMVAAFRSGEDIHTVTASQVFGTPPEQVTRLQRSHAKAVNFGIVYGISAWSLAQDIGVLPAEAKAYMDAYLEKYHGVREYQKRIVAQAKADGYVATLYHRRRALPELKSSNFAQRSFGERVALNMPIQGTAADVIKLAMVQVRRRLKEEGLAAKLILQVHDELIVECPEAECARVKALLTGEMERVAQLSVPLIAEAGAGKSWADAH